jgi:transposase InsO family protein
VFRVKKRDFLSLVGEKVTIRPKRRRAQPIEKHNEELKKKRRETLYQKKRYLVADLRARDLSVRQISGKIGMSLGFVHKWCGRLDVQIRIRRRSLRRGKVVRDHKEKGIKEAIVSVSRAPKQPRRKITPEHRRMIKEVRKEKFTKNMGAQKIVAYLDMDISHQSVNKVLKEEGLTAKRKKRKQRSFVPFRRGYSNELWQIDFKEFGKGVYMFSVKDDYSSKILVADIRSTCTTEDVKEVLEKAIKLFGKPKQILSDHGTQFTSIPWSENHAFVKWCSKNGIGHIMGRIRKPTTQGKIERWHGSVLEEADLPPKGSSVEEYRKAVLEYMEFYNNRRPHHGIGLHVPVNVYLGGLILPEVITLLGVHEVT